MLKFLNSWNLLDANQIETLLRVGVRKLLVVPNL